MSHVASGFCVTDIEALKQVVQQQCPELELVAQKSYRTWISDNGELVGDYPLPWLYQIKLLGKVAAKVGKEAMYAAAKTAGVTLPENLLDLEKKPMTLDQQRQLLQNPAFNEAYKEVSKTLVGKDADYVIRYKQGHGPSSAYEIGLVRHPVNQGEFIMMTDFYSQGNGLLRAKGLGQHVHHNGKDSWGAELKKSYAVTAAERKIQQQIKAGNPEFGSYKKVTLPDGRIKIEVTPRNP